MAIHDVPNTQVHAIALGVTATGFRGPTGARFAYVRRSDVPVSFQVIDATANVAQQDLDGQNIDNPVAGAVVRACAGPIPADSWHLIQLADEDAPSLGAVVRQPILYLQAQTAFPVEAKKCWLRFTRAPL